MDRRKSWHTCLISTLDRFSLSSYYFEVEMFLIEVVWVDLKAFSVRVHSSYTYMYACMFACDCAF